VSPALKFWYDTDTTKIRTGLPVAKDILDKAGYKVVGGKLSYPAGVKETLKSN
jgi:peptide/nickel transport system substrate-binding protein